MKKLLAVISCLALLILSACASSAAEGGKTKITVALYTNATHINTKNFEKIAANFEDENPDIDVEVQPGGNEFEAQMKTKMAANDLPDLFTTHGWSVMRYSEFLEPLQDEPWAKKINPLIKDNITDKEGNILTLPMDVDVTGLVFNKDVLDEAGVDAMEIKTWADFLAACEKIKATGKTPINIAGPKDYGHIGTVVDVIAPTYLITNEKKNYREELKNGTFNWKHFGPVYELFNTFVQEGYLNKDVKEGSYMGSVESFAKNESAFGFYTNELITQVKEINPDANFGYIAVPAATEADTPTVITGERFSVGVWKDSENKEAAMKFLNYLSEPENINLMASGTKNPTGLVGDGYQSDLAGLEPYYEQVKDLRAFNYFDREYLPSGMWDSLIKAGESIINEAASKEEIIDKLSQDYTKLYKQQN
ncbi:carbohydrate ABC transporter substrate-binding protein [Bacillaceae bacterium Marseille-Q3522]|nr:carbohydrate ABC transporter substrate-binding protein [Bacillaceae bacterium Marseille-Q3522]